MSKWIPTITVARWVAPWVFALATGSTACAQESPWRLVVGAGLANGGDTITSGTITTDATGKVLPYDIKAGSGFLVRLGTEYRVSDSFSLQGTVGYSNTAPMGYNGSLTFVTVPLEFMAFANLTSAARVGFGVRSTYAEMSGTGVAANWLGNGRWDSSDGAVLEFQYLFGPRNSGKSAQFGWSARLINEKFSRLGAQFNGNNYELGAVVYY